MQRSGKWVVVGGDGLIGSYLTRLSGSAPARVVPTTRRKAANAGRLFADLESGEVADVIAADADVVFLCAAMTDIQACRDNPELSCRVNVTGTVDLAAQLVERGAFVILLSSNTVFDGSVPRPDEHEPRRPVTEYGLQKARAEEQLLALPKERGQVAVVRLSKVLSPVTGIAAECLRRFRMREPCRVFDDLKMSPISLRYVAAGLFAVAVSKQPGIFHLSGVEEPSYAEFARRLANHVGADPALAESISSTQAGIEVLFRPVHPALGMTRTRKQLGLEPEPMEQLLEELSKSEEWKHEC